MAVSVAVCEIFSVKEWCDLENWVKVLLQRTFFYFSERTSYVQVLQKFVLFYFLIKQFFLNKIERCNFNICAKK